MQEHLSYNENVASENYPGAAQAHLLMHFTAHGPYNRLPVPVAVRGDGCFIETIDGRRYFDGLSGLFCAQLGYDFGAEIGAVARQQLMTLPYYTNWSFSHPPAVELASRLAALAPDDLNHCLFTSGGSEAVESAVKLVWQYHALSGQPQRRKLIARRNAYHGSTGIALSLTGLHGIKAEFEPLFEGVRHVSPTKQLHRCEQLSPEQWTAELLRELRELIEHEGPETVAAVFVEPVQNSGGSIPPPDGYGEAISKLCAEYGVLLVADEVICGFGRLGHWFGSDRYGLQPDLITFAKGVSAGYAPIGGVLVSDAVAEPFLQGSATLNHGFTFGGHPLATAVACKAIEILEREDVNARVIDTEPHLESSLRALEGRPMVGEVRGSGFFWSIELLDPATSAPFSHRRADEAIDLLRSFVDERDLICRVDRRSGDVVITVAPPLVASEPELSMLAETLGDAIDHATATL